MDDTENTIYYAESEMGEPNYQPVIYGHDKLTPALVTGKLEAIYRVRQPIHIGTGILLPPEELGLTSKQKLVKSFFRVGKNLRIPGTSLKGVFRSSVEMYTASCAPATRGGNACRFRNNTSLLCPACHIFGAMGYQGLINFEDGIFFSGRKTAIQEIPPQFGPKPHHGMRRYYPHDLVDGRNRTWPVEVVLPEATFLMKASFRNLSKGELGLVLIALGLGEWQLCPKIGAGKSAGLGAIQIEHVLIEVIDPQKAYTQFEAQSEQVKAEPYIEAARKQINLEILDQLAEDLSAEQLGKEHS